MVTILFFNDCYKNYAGTNLQFCPGAVFTASTNNYKNLRVKPVG